MNSDQNTKSEVIGSVEPETHAIFNSLFGKYLKLIDDNKYAFIAYDEAHNDQSAHDIFSTYWFLEATSSTIENERVTLTRKPTYTHLPEKLRALII